MRRTPEQLPLPGSLTEVTALREELQRADQYINTWMLRHADAFDKLLDTKRELQQANSRIAALQTQCDFLYDLIRTSTRPPSAARPPEALAQRTWMRQELTRLLGICHPDKWQGNPAAEELTKHVIVLRQRLQEGQG